MKSDTYQLKYVSITLYFMPYSSSMCGIGQSKVPHTKECCIVRNNKSSDAVFHFSYRNKLSSMYVPGFNIIRGIAIDYMHGTLLGVVKMLVNLWLDKQHHEEPCYIGKWARELEKRYTSIKPPSCISRLPRSFVGNFGHLKASELRSFLLFYSLPCLYGLLPDSYFQHYLLLVEAIYILLKHSISMNELTKASKLLKHFCIRIEELYGGRYETYNVHGLLHLVERVKDLGPLWTHSCFCFEDFNGELRHLYHGTQHVEMQIVLSICVQQKIPELVPLLPPDSGALQFFETLTSKGRWSHKREIVCDNIFIIGAIVKHTIKIQHRQLLEREIGEVGEIFKFKRVCIDGMIFHCKEYKPGIRRNNFTVQYQSPSCPQLNLWPSFIFYQVLHEVPQSCVLFRALLL